MIDLSTSYLGLSLPSPLVASAGPLCEALDNIRRMEDAGAAAVVLHSLFEEQITVESGHLDWYLSHGTESYPEAMTYFPDVASYRIGPDAYLEHIRRAKAAVGIPVIGSLNGVSRGGWTEYARKIEQAGADALELNVYYIPTDPDMTADEVERRHVDLVRDVKASVGIPVAVKLGHVWSAPANLARRLDRAGADGLVLFNRFYQPDIDVENLAAEPALRLSDSSELLLRLRWLAIVHPAVKIPLAISGGVHTPLDAVKAIMAGAGAVQLVSALLKLGPQQLRVIRKQVEEWMEEHEYASLAQMTGSMSLSRCPDPNAFSRANYMRILQSWRV